MHSSLKKKEEEKRKRSHRLITCATSADSSIRLRIAAAFSDSSLACSTSCCCRKSCTSAARTPAELTSDSRVSLSSSTNRFRSSISFAVALSKEIINYKTYKKHISKASCFYVIFSYLFLTLTFVPLLECA